MFRRYRRDRRPAHPTRSPARLRPGLRCSLMLSAWARRTASALAIALACRAEYRTFAARRTLEAGANLGQAESQLGHRAAQRVTVHAKLLGGLALVAPMRKKHFA